MARNSLKNICRLVEATTNDLPVEQSFLADLKHSIEVTDEKNFRKPSQTFKPSSMNCIRNMYYQVSGAETDPPESSYCMVGICNSGSDIHIRVQSAVEDMKNNGIDCEYIDVADYIKSRNLDYLEVLSKNCMETKLHYTSLNMTFLCDGIIRYKGHYYILELKTESSFKWNNRTNVDPKHYKQGTAYSVALGLPEVLFVYINRDILDMKAYMFVPTDDMKNDLVGMIDTCTGYVNRGITPPKPENLPKNTCSYCGYKTVCKRDS